VKAHVGGNFGEDGSSANAWKISDQNKGQISREPAVRKGERSGPDIEDPGETRGAA